ncbi:MAG TPA: hypothetical protein VFV67_01240 [Actinophytocola sp.]|uniref:sensor histidine kinase n=1 Tax=Actinophytocola sp. TaxID=1872138 RepID=UPI002DB9D03E|nr:hypothetical protein [Actinophytocola sp.]HEU5469248.1 hypothetical protein [Actinophytocola sp.]
MAGLVRSAPSKLEAAVSTATPPPVLPVADGIPLPLRLRVRAAASLLFGGSLGWRDPMYLVTKPGEERALRFIAMLLLIQRASYLVPAMVAVANHTDAGYRSQAVNLAMLVVAVTWNAGLAVGIRKRGWFPQWTVGADVALVCLLMFVGTMNCSAEHMFTGLNWAPKLGYGTAALVGAALAPWPALFAWLPIAAARLGALILAFGTLPVPVDGIDGLLNSYLWFAVALHFMRRYLCGQGRMLDETTQRQLAVEARRAADRARFAERISQHRKLHDTVLATLTAIARGGLDHRTDQVRDRCAADADHVRRMIHEDASPFTTLGAKLADVIEAAEFLGMRVHYLHDALPADVPAEVIDAVAGATREALNNVLAHSGTAEAWLTVTWDEDILTVYVTDRGSGFDSATVRPGFGLRSSIMERMREAGGSATVFGMVDNGVRVELVWPVSADSGTVRPPVPG